MHAQPYRLCGRVLFMKFETLLFALAFFFLAMISFPRKAHVPENPNPPRLQAGSPFPAAYAEDVELGEAVKPHLTPVSKPVTDVTTVEEEAPEETGNP
jgi:hypothetical protein